MTLSKVFRWVLVPFASMSACAATNLATGKMFTWTVDSVLRLDAQVGISYAIAAALFVVIGAVVAPNYRVLIACFLYLVGAYIAWYVLKDWYFPEGHSMGYQRSLVPMWLTLCGGFVGVAAIALASFVTRVEGFRAVPLTRGDE
jgi:hypothetical protein